MREVISDRTLDWLGIEDPSARALVSIGWASPLDVIYPPKQCKYCGETMPYDKFITFRGGFIKEVLAELVYPIKKRSYVVTSHCEYCRKRGFDEPSDDILVDQLIKNRPSRLAKQELHDKGGTNTQS